MTEALLVGAGIVVVLALAGFAIWQSRRAGAAEADSNRLTKDIERATDANKARADVDGMSDSDVDRELRDDFRRDVPGVPPDPPRA